MQSDKRKDERYEDIGRVEAPELCVFPGVLQDISMLGCRVRFPMQFDPDMEMDIEMRVIPAHKRTLQPISLIGHPMWVRHDDNSTEIGFKLLRSPDSRELHQYVQRLALAEAEFEEEEEMLALCAAI